MLDIMSHTQVQNSLKELFKYTFITNCHLDQSSVTTQQMNTLQELDSIEILENFKDVIEQLFTFKKANLDSQTNQLVKRTAQLEKLLQKLQGQIRQHIRIEHQLKLHIDSLQNKIDKLQASSDNIENLKTSYEAKILGCQKEIAIKDQILQRIQKEYLSLKEKVKKQQETIIRIKTLRLSSSSVGSLKKKLRVRALEQRLKGKMKQYDRPQAKTARDTQLFDTPQKSTVLRGHKRNCSDARLFAGKKSPK